MTPGKIHSIESFGTLDGPGVRTVVFMQGCPNRCIYCHNVDCAIPEGGTEYSPQELISEVLKNKEYWNEYGSNTVKGGITFSGGDPLFQPEFLKECVAELKERIKVHIAVDTSAASDFTNIEKLIPKVDLWMISIKHMDSESHTELVGRGNEEILKNISTLDEKLVNTGKQIRIRFVIIPGYTDSDEHLNTLGGFVRTIRNLEKVELLPYSRIGRHKWVEIFGKYKLENVPEPTAEDVERVKKILSSYTNKI